MVRVEDEENVQCVFEGRVGPIAVFSRAKEHVQKIAGIAELIVGIHERHAERMTIGEGRDRGHLANQAIGLLLARLSVKNFLGIVIESGERGDRGNHHAHGVGVIVKSVEKFLDALVNEGVVSDVVRPFLELRSGG